MTGDVVIYSLKCRSDLTCVRVCDEKLARHTQRSTETGASAPASPELSQESISPMGQMRPSTMSPWGWVPGHCTNWGSLLWGTVLVMGCRRVACWGCAKLIMGCLGEKPKVWVQVLWGGTNVQK